MGTPTSPTSPGTGYLPSYLLGESTSHAVSVSIYNCTYKYVQVLACVEDLNASLLALYDSIHVHQIFCTN